MTLYSRFMIAITAVLSLSVHGVGQTTLLPGEARVVMSSGDSLVTGGDVAGDASKRAYIRRIDGTTSSIDAGMLSAREGHSLTALPNGQVLVFGGSTGTNGTYVRSMELFDPTTMTFFSITGSSLVPRMGHSATLLSNGVVVVIGGTTEGGAFARDIEFWDYRTGNVRSLDLGLYLPRSGHEAFLLWNGTILIVGGVGTQGAPIHQSELFVPEAQSFQLLNPGIDPQLEEPNSFLAWSDPGDGATGVALAETLKLRFSRRVLPSTITPQTVVLQTESGDQITGVVAAAENGRLAFFRPASPLSPGVTYTVSVNNIEDLTGDKFSSFSLSFQTDGVIDTGADDGWAPSQNAYNGNWNSGTGLSPMQQLPALKAEPGVTALSGQVLGLSGRPLARVTLSVDSVKATTDETGRFLLKNVPAGHGVLVIDGATANKGAVSYGFFESGVDIQANKTNTLNYTIWMTRLDTAHAVNVPSPTTQPDTVISSPLIPGLELHLPKGTTIVGRHGEKITQLTLTPIPLDKPPFPLPTGLKVPLYFTIQPGGAEIRVPISAQTHSGAQLYYPNTYKEPSGTTYNFWNYDPTSRGWYIYGNGRVDSAQNQIIPDPGVYVYELTGAMVGGASAAKPAEPSGPPGADPVDLGSGLFIYQKTDLALTDVLPIELTRTYTSNDHYPRPFGIGAMDNYDIFMVGDTYPYTYQELNEPNGTKIRFNRISSGTGYADALYQSSAMNGPWYGATMWYNQTPGNGFQLATWIVKNRNGMLFNFPDSEFKDDQVHQALIGIQDTHGNQVKLVRDVNALLTSITSPSGKSIALSYDASSRIIQATDSTGRSVSYTYDSAGRLATATDVLGGTTTFAYNSNDAITTITDARGIQDISNQYDSYGRVIQQTEADGGIFTFAWTPSSNSSQQWITSGLPVNRYDPSQYEGYTGLISQVVVTDPKGYIRQLSYDNLGRLVTDVRAQGQPEQQTFTYQYYADNLLKWMNDPLGRATAIDYDTNSNLTSLTALSGMANASTITATYDPFFNHLLTFTDQLGHSAQFTYSNVGDLSSFTDATGNSATMSYDPLGRMESMKDALGNTYTLRYEGSNLSTITDPVGDVIHRYSDERGNLRALVDPMGSKTTYEFDNMDKLTSMQDALGNVATFSYDANENLTSVRDFSGNTTQYSYDSMDRIVGASDALHRTMSLTYDLDGNIASYLDRKGQTFVDNYDGIGRRTFSGYGAQSANGAMTYQSSITWQYDSGNRVASAADSIAGTISRTYDGFDNLISESTPQGMMSYSYDAANRRSTAQAGGATQISYGYDNANRLTGLSRGSTQISIGYDTAGRRSNMVLPNGVNVSYSFDQASRLQTLAYSYGGASIGSLSYSYDAGGHETGVSGSLAGVLLPSALTLATYDGANQLLTWGGVAASYDANGNMVNNVDGNQYAWNARNQLVGISGNAIRGFGYDAFGRRVAENDGTNTTYFQYDGLNRIADVTGSDTSTWLTGGVDEGFQLTDSSGTWTPLVNEAGSVIALTDSTGSIATSYAYEPFGSSQSSGMASGNRTQYAGRENDLTGLYYNRARYYSPGLGRFISEDPLGLTQGLNVHLYVGDNPTGFTDPLGAEKVPFIFSPGGPGSGPGWGAIGGMVPNAGQDPDDPKGAPDGWGGALGGALGGLAGPLGKGAGAGAGAAGFPELGPPLGAAVGGLIGGAGDLAGQALTKGAKGCPLKDFDWGEAAGAAAAGAAAGAGTGEGGLLDDPAGAALGWLGANPSIAMYFGGPALGLGLLGNAFGNVINNALPPPPGGGPNPGAPGGGGESSRGGKPKHC